jgi:hypothetical protein
MNPAAAFITPPQPVASTPVPKKNDEQQIFGQRSAREFPSVVCDLPIVLTLTLEPQRRTG